MFIVLVARSSDDTRSPAPFVDFAQFQLGETADGKEPLADDLLTVLVSHAEQHWQIHNILQQQTPTISPTNVRTERHWTSEHTTLHSALKDSAGASGLAATPNVWQLPIGQVRDTARHVSPTISAGKPTNNFTRFSQQNNNFSKKFWPKISSMIFRHYIKQLPRQTEKP